MTYIDRKKSLLKSIKNPASRPYQNTHKIPELTFMGCPNQPDFGKLTISIVYAERIIELKSLREYILSWREIHVSYERILDTIYQDLWETYRPNGLILILETNPRGGISSRLTMPA